MVSVAFWVTEGSGYEKGDAVTQRAKGDLLPKCCWAHVFSIWNRNKEQSPAYQALHPLQPGPILFLRAGTANAGRVPGLPGLGTIVLAV